MAPLAPRHPGKSMVSYSLIALVASLAPASARYEPIDFPFCGSAEYFDISALGCRPCPSSQEPDAAGTSCQCSSGFLSGDVCVPCNATGAAPTRDGTACVPCTLGNSSQPDCQPDDYSCALSPGADGECRCTPGHGLVIVERYDNGALLPVKKCEPCPLGSYPASANSGDGCVACPAEHMLANSDYSRCVCQSGFQLIQHAGGFWGRDESCVSVAAYNELEGDYPSSAAQLTYYSLPASQGGTLTIPESKLVTQLLMPSATDCLRAVQASESTPRSLSLLEGDEACQAVGNLCVLYDYDEGSSACRLYRQLQSEASGTVNPGNQEWRARLPGLYYPDRGRNALSQAAPPITTTLALPPLEGSRLRYLLAGYSLNGTFEGLSELTDQLQLCASGGSSGTTSFLDFGTDIHVSCNAPLVSLLAADDITFYDLYLYYDGTRSPSTPKDQIEVGSLYPIPVLVKNFRANGVNYHDNDQTFDDQLTRRFFTVDALSGAATAAELPAVVRYLRRARLTMTIRSDDGLPTQMLPPLLEIEYADVALGGTGDTPLEAQAALAAANVELKSEFEVRHTMQMDDSNVVINNLFIITIVLWVLGSLANGVILVRRNRGGNFDGYHRLVAQMCSVFSSTFFFLVYGISTWWLITYKGQTTLYFLMPVEGKEGHYYLGLMPFEVLIGVLFGAKCLHMLDILSVQTSHDLFFIDWEQPRSAGAAGAGAGSQEEADEESKSELPISVWRTIFVANEWVKLQEARTVSTELNLLFVLFLLEGVDIIHSAKLVPSDAVAGSEVPYHMVLRFALSAGLLLASSLAQWLFMYGFWQRYYRDRVWQFVDLLAVTNISCLLLEERYYGFYLHGRSVHDHADNDMAQLNAHLKLEAEGFTPTRGFTPDSHTQTYEVHLARKVREKYDATAQGILEGAMPSRRRPGRSGTERAPNPRSKGFRAAPEEGVMRQRELNRYLMSYLGTPQPSAGGSGGSTTAAGRDGAGERPVVRPMGLWERYGVPPEMGYGDRSIFLEDASGRFKRLLLAGREYDVVLLNILTYALFDMITSNTFVAVFTTYALDVALRIVRSERATANIARKTLLDDRFLL